MRLLVVFVVDLLWDALLFFGMLEQTGPVSTGMPNLAFPFLWVFPFIAYLVILYRNAVFVSWQRIIRALTLCVMAFAGAQMGLTVSVWLIKLAAQVVG
jgi:hypothetical protein